MFLRIRQILFTCIAFCLGTAEALPQDQVSDSLKNLLGNTSDPHVRIALLLNLKDLNEDNEFNQPYSTQLFREAAAIGDTYAMRVATPSIINRYGVYAEKEDSLYFYIRALRKMAPGTPEEGIAEYTELTTAYLRLTKEIDSQQRIRIARDIDAWCERTNMAEGNLYRRTTRLLLMGMTATYLPEEDRKKTQIANLEEACRLISSMPDPAIRRIYAELGYNSLATSYFLAKEYDLLTALTDQYIRQIDDYLANERKIGRRPYLNGGNGYQLAYWHLIRSTVRAEKPECAGEYFEEFRQRIHSDSSYNPIRNLYNYYELGYLWKIYTKEYEQSLQFSDSLIGLIERRQGNLAIKSSSIAQSYRNRSGIMKSLGRYSDAFDAYARTFRVQDSLYMADRNNRLKTIVLRNEMDRLLLDRTRTSIRNHITAISSTALIAILLAATGIYYYRALRRNRRLQAEIFRHSHKALESERMKSMFVNSICNHIRAPFDAVDQAAYKLTIRNLSESERTQCLDTIRKNTESLLSTLDNMFEAASLDSLTEQLQLAPTDIGIICNAEICRAQQQRPNAKVQYILESPQAHCVVQMHAHYFTFVVRALLDNAGKFTTQGKITLDYVCDTEKKELRVSVSDTGCGISAEKYKAIFGSEIHNPAFTHGMGLALCRLIALHLQGDIRIDEGYAPGTKFIFTTPLHA